jgi:hypothetical protein
VRGSGRSRPAPLVAFACPVRPISVNARPTVRKRETYRNKLLEAFKEAVEDLAMLDDLPYGVVYLFSLHDRGYDADNISKPLWDALRGVAYRDASAVRLRVAGVLDMRTMDLASLDLTTIPERTTKGLLDLLGKEAHVLYVEIGPLRPALYRFGIGTSEK